MAKQQKPRPSQKLKQTLEKKMVQAIAAEQISQHYNKEIEDLERQLSKEVKDVSKVKDNLSYIKRSLNKFEKSMAWKARWGKLNVSNVGTVTPTGTGFQVDEAKLDKFTEKYSGKIYNAVKRIEDVKNYNKASNTLRIAIKKYINNQISSLPTSAQLGNSLQVEIIRSRGQKLINDLKKKKVDELTGYASNALTAKGGVDPDKLLGKGLNNELERLKDTSKEYSKGMYMKMKHSQADYKKALNWRERRRVNRLTIGDPVGKAIESFYEEFDKLNKPGSSTQQMQKYLSAESKGLKGILTYLREDALLRKVQGKELQSIQYTQNAARAITEGKGLGNLATKLYADYVTKPASYGVKQKLDVNKVKSNSGVDPVQVVLGAAKVLKPEYFVPQGFAGYATATASTATTDVDTQKIVHLIHSRKFIKELANMGLYSK